MEQDIDINAAAASDSQPRASPESPASPTVKKRAHRVSRACDFCHSRSIRCRPSDQSSSSCQSCIEYDRKCSYDRPSKKRGVKSNLSRISTSGAPSSMDPAMDCGDNAPQLDIPGDIAQGTITDLVEIYFEVVYPIFPFFHRRTLLHRISRGEHNHDRAFFVALMSLCGLMAARIRDGAVFSRECSAQALEKMPPSQTFFDLGEAAIPKGPKASESLDHLRSCALLALLSIQDGNIPQMKFSLNVYHMLVQLDGMDRESNWPADLGRIEVEERRRLFWSMYSLDMFSAACFDSPIVCREAHAIVAYPTEIDDEDWTNDEGSPQKRQSPAESMVSGGGPSSTASRGPSSTARGEGVPSWIIGWNFAMDLHRVLEHALDRQRVFVLNKTSFVARSQLHAHESANATVFEDIMTRYKALPWQFKEIRNLTFNPREDRYGFEATNIAATFQLVRMTLCSTEGITTRERVQLAEEVLKTFSEVPIGYLKAISTPILHYIAGVGSFLAQTLQGQFSQGDYQQVRAVLFKLAKLLSGLDIGISSGGSPGMRLETQITKLDWRAEARRQQVFGDQRIPASGEDSNFAVQYSFTEISDGVAAEQSPTFLPFENEGGASNISFMADIDMVQDRTWPFNFDRAHE